jgi:hypothetical protein
LPSSDFHPASEELRGRRHEDRPPIDETFILINISRATRARVTVMAEGAFERAMAEAIRQAVLKRVTGLPADDRATVVTALGLFSAALNAVREKPGSAACHRAGGAHAGRRCRRRSTDEPAVAGRDVVADALYPDGQLTQR